MMLCLIWSAASLVFLNLEQSSWHGLGFHLVELLVLALFGLLEV